MMGAIALRTEPGITKAACAAMGVTRSSFYRRRTHLAQPPAEPRPRPRPDRALTTVERQAVLDLMREPRFADLAPAEIYATLLDQGLYYCSVRTMYRILDENSEVRERRNQLRHPEYKKPRP